MTAAVVEASAERSAAPPPDPALRKPRRVGPARAPVAAPAQKRCGAGARARGALFALVCLGWESAVWRCDGVAGVAGVAGELVELDSDLASWMQSWMPWKRYNYSTPLAAGQYCPHQHCMRCSAPYEWDPHPYRPCRAVPLPARNRTSQSDTTNDTMMQLEVASSHHPFHGLLLCSTAPTVNLSLDSVNVELIKEGGTLFDTEGKVLYPSTSSSFLMPVVGEKSGKRYLEAVEYGVLSDFLADDEYYASTFEYQRYDQFRTWDYTSSIAAGLVRSPESGSNCMLLSSKAWKRRTRYELTITFSGGVNVSHSPVWLAPLYYEEYTDLSPGGLGIEETEEIGGSANVAILALSVRGTKLGAVCTMDSVPGGAQAERNETSHADICTKPGFVTSPRTGECIACPRLNDAVRDKDCQLKTNGSVLSWPSWSNEGHSSKNLAAASWTDCCASNTYPQLVGNQACGATISPNLADSDLSAANVEQVLPERVCQRYTYIREVFERSFCPLKCLQDGNLDFRKKPFGNLEVPKEYATFGSRCMCVIDVLQNASVRFNDAYLAEGLVSDFMYHAAGEILKALVDDFSLVRTRRIARAKGVDLDARRPESPTRLRGLGGRLIRVGLFGTGGKNQDDKSFYDMYNNFVWFKQDERNIAQSVHDERGRVEDFDTQYHAELNIRYLGLLLSEFVNATFMCKGLFDLKAENATKGLMWGHRDPYWPNWGHSINEF